MSAGSSWESRSQWSPSFLSLDPSLEKGIGILKVSIPVSKKGLPFWKSRSQSRKRDWSFKSLDSSLEKGIQALKILRSVFLEKLNYTIIFLVESLDPSLNHCDTLQSISLDPSLEKVIDILNVSIPVSKKGLAYWKSRSQSRKSDWGFQSLDPSLEKGINILKVSILSRFPKPSLAHHWFGSLVKYVASWSELHCTEPHKKVKFPSAATTPSTFSNKKSFVFQ